MTTYRVRAACLAALVLALPTAATAQRDTERFDERSFYDDKRGGQWDRIGQVTVRPRVEREVLRVSPREEAFSRIGLRAYDGDIEVVELNVRFANNETERLRVNRVIRAGTGMPPIDLSGRARRLKEIEVVYRPFGPARLEIVGREGGPGPGAGRWQPLGCQKVGFLDGKDVIRVGKNEGQFRAVKLSVQGNKVRLENLRVVYGNGEAEDLAVRTVIPEGAETRAIDLSGRRRGIDRIELRYIPQINFGGRANVCAFGQQ